MSDVLDQLSARVAAVSREWAGALAPTPRGELRTRDLALDAPLTLGVETIREGWLLHRGASRIAPDIAPDLALLVGDWCYAAGLCDVTEHGTLHHIAVLASLIADLSARADAPMETLEARWDAGFAALCAVPA